MPDVAVNERPPRSDAARKAERVACVSCGRLSHCRPVVVAGVEVRPLCGWCAEQIEDGSADVRRERG